MLCHPGVPDHDLRLKQGSVCLLMRNISVKTGLVKNARVLIKQLRDHYALISVLDENGREQRREPHLIPRIHFEFEPPNTNFTIIRKQLPLRLAYATTFHSCQGLTLDRVVLDIRTQVFAHGQLYTALSRVREKNTIQILTENNADKSTLNVVYKQLLL